MTEAQDHTHAPRDRRDQTLEVRNTSEAPIVCFSHLRWDFVFQRPQHLMTRFSRQRRVYFVEEPVACNGPARLERREVAPSITVVVPRLSEAEIRHATFAETSKLRALVRSLVREVSGVAGALPVLWFYTPMSFPIARDLESRLVVYDCMDQLSSFRFAPASIEDNERALLQRADLVFTGGHSLHEAKRRQHRHVFVFPSSVDVDHFAQARYVADDPVDLGAIAGPRVGYYGVIDERIDLGLIAHAASVCPDLQWVFVGPVVKIDPDSLPRAPNIHYLGSKRYEELPGYLGRWDAAMMPFALNEATRFISPTKTPEYLAGGCAVASTPIVDVVRSWGTGGPVFVGQGPDGFVASVRSVLKAEARGLVMTIMACFVTELVLMGPDWNAICVGFLPRVQALRDPEVLYLAIGIVGATVMPHNLYLHSSLARDRRHAGGDGRETARALRISTWDTVGSLGIALLVNAAILAHAAGAFHGNGYTSVAQIEDAYRLLDPEVGAALASTLFGIALLAAGQSSTLTGTLAGQIILEGFLGLKLAKWKVQLATRLLAILPALVGLLWAGDHGVGSLLVASQVVLSFQLPFAIWPLMRMTGDPRIMGEFANGRALRIVGLSVLGVVVLANLWLVMR